GRRGLARPRGDDAGSRLPGRARPRHVDRRGRHRQPMVAGTRGRTGAGRRPRALAGGPRPGASDRAGAVEPPVLRSGVRASLSRTWSRAFRLCNAFWWHKTEKPAKKNNNDRCTDLLDQIHRGALFDFVTPFGGTTPETPLRNTVP